MGEARPEPRFLTLDEAAALAGVTRHAIYVAVRRGELAAIRLGGRGQWRVERAVLEEWMRRGRDGHALIPTDQVPDLAE